MVLADVVVAPLGVGWSRLKVDDEATKGKIHRVDPEFGSTLTVSNRDFQSNCWVNLRILGQPCEFYLVGRRLRARAAGAGRA